MKKRMINKGTIIKIVIVAILSIIGHYVWDWSLTATAQDLNIRTLHEIQECMMDI